MAFCSFKQPPSKIGGDTYNKLSIPDQRATIGGHPQEYSDKRYTVVFPSGPRFIGNTKNHLGTNGSTAVKVLPGSMMKSGVGIEKGEILK